MEYSSSLSTLGEGVGVRADQSHIKASFLSKAKKKGLAPPVELSMTIVASIVPMSFKIWLIVDLNKI